MVERLENHPFSSLPSNVRSSIYDYMELPPLGSGKHWVGFLFSCKQAHEELQLYNRVAVSDYLRKLPQNFLMAGYKTQAWKRKKNMELTIASNFELLEHMSTGRIGVSFILSKFFDKVTFCFSEPGSSQDGERIRGLVEDAHFVLGCAISDGYYQRGHHDINPTYIMPRTNVREIVFAWNVGGGVPDRLTGDQWTYSTARKVEWKGSTADYVWPWMYSVTTKDESMGKVGVYSPTRWTLLDRRANQLEGELVAYLGPKYLGEHLGYCWSDGISNEVVYEDDDLANMVTGELDDDDDEPKAQRILHGAFV